jgi:hypothetical protein
MGLGKSALVWLCTMCVSPALILVCVTPAPYTSWIKPTELFPGKGVKLITYLHPAKM